MRLSLKNSFWMPVDSRLPCCVDLLINGIRGENQTSCLGGPTVLPVDVQTFDHLLREYFAPAGGLQ